MLPPPRTGKEALSAFRGACHMPPWASVTRPPEGLKQQKCVLPALEAEKSKPEVSAGLVPSMGCGGMCPRPLSHVMDGSLLPVFCLCTTLCPNILSSYGCQLYWIRTHPNDLILTLLPL